jgi:hypothetical protein
MSLAADKPFGIRGDLIPIGDFKEINEDITHDGGLVVSIHDGIFEIGYENETEKIRAQKIAEEYIAWWSFRNVRKISVNLNMSWKPDGKGHRRVEIMLVENIGINDRLITTVIKKEMSYVVKQHADSYCFSNDVELVKKAENDEVLSLVLKYYYDEVLNADHPKVGVYRIVEELEKKMGGIEQLAALVGKGKKFITDIRRSTQNHRHAFLFLGRSWRPSLSEQECVERARLLIQSYAALICLNNMS